MNLEQIKKLEKKGLKVEKAPTFKEHQDFKTISFIKKPSILDVINAKKRAIEHFNLKDDLEENGKTAEQKITYDMYLVSLFKDICLFDGQKKDISEILGASNTFLAMLQEAWEAISD